MPSYNLNAVSCVVGGALISGAAEDGLVEIEFDDDAWTLTKGADGTAVRSKTNDRSATVTIRLMPGSPSNLVLQAIFAADELSGLGAVPFALRDPSSNDTFTSAGLWVQKLPGRNFTREVTSSEWVCRAGTMVAAFGASLPSNV
jgi:hypothetical protein